MAPAITCNGLKASHLAYISVQFLSYIAITVPTVENLWHPSLLKHVMAWLRWIASLPPPLPPSPSSTCIVKNCFYQMYRSWSTRKEPVRSYESHSAALTFLMHCWLGYMFHVITISRNLDSQADQWCWISLSSELLDVLSLTLQKWLHPCPEQMKIIFN